MSYPATVYRIMIASPGDVLEERKSIREVIHKWNAIHSAKENIILLPVSWEMDASPEFGRPQEIINEQVLKDADLLIAAFWTRIGSSTGRAPSGTVEEIEEHIKEGRPAMLYFSNASFRRKDVDLEQMGLLDKLKADYQNRALCEPYDDLADFREKFSHQLSHTIIRHFIKKPSSDILTKDLSKIDTTPTLSDTAKTLLLDVFHDSSGELIKVRTRDGLSINTNGKELVNRKNARDEARWESATEELLHNKLLADRGTKGEILAITNSGYEFAESLNPQMAPLKLSSLEIEIIRLRIENFRLSTTPLIVLYPSDNEHVSRELTVKGYVKYTNSSVWVIIRDVVGYWVQKKATISNDGSWKTEVVVGQVGEDDVDSYFQLRVAVNPKTRLKIGESLNEWPDAEYLTEPIKVKRT